VNRPLPRWPLYLIAAPAAVAVWSGWVGLGTLCGFGVVHPLPGIADGFTINTAITLPVGDLGQGQGASATGLAPAPGPGPGQPNHAAELAEAERIRAMPMDQFMAERERLGIRSSTSMTRLFGETR
jgi:hypothetical protein